MSWRIGLPHASRVNKLKVKQLGNHVCPVVTTRLMIFLTPGEMKIFVELVVGISALFTIALRKFGPTALVGLGRYLGAGPVPSSSGPETHTELHKPL